MRITLLVVGKTVKGWTKDALEIYSKRLSHYINFEIKEIPELKNASAMSRDVIKTKEGQLILDNIRPDDRVILLDERGTQYTSMQWAEILQSQLHQGKNIVYVVGGAYGFSDAVYARADAKISLSKLTFSHQMVRVFFTEQLYRCFTIINGEPYHHE